MTRYERAAAKLMGFSGLVGVFRGLRRRRGQWTSEPTLTCFVRRKRNRTALAKSDCIPRSIDGVATDIIAIGRDHDIVRGRDRRGGETIRFSVPGESGSLVFDDARRAIGFVVGGGRDPDEPNLAVSFVLRSFTKLEASLDNLFPLFFARSQS